ncbi:MAG: SPOR domain-containing protein [Bacteroidota bacterium]
MKHLPILFPLCFLITFCFPNTSHATLTAEYTFTIHVGAFVKAKLSDFRNIRSYGYVYAEPAENNLTRIYMGDFETETAAYQVLKEVKTHGYPEAFVTRKKLNSGTPLHLIQLGVEQVGANINWSRYNRAGALYTALIGQQIKILSGPYTDATETSEMLKTIRAAGFRDAFAKKLNSALLHPVTAFEADMELSNVALEPLATSTEVLTEKTVPKKKGGLNLMVKPKKSSTSSNQTSTPPPTDIPQSYDAVVLTEKAGSSSSGGSIQIALPDIRKNVKRNSVLELQKVLKQEKAYSGSLDGYYGKGSTNGWVKIKGNNRQLRKYQLLAQHREAINQKGTNNILQYYLDHLLKDPNRAVQGLQNSKEPIAKAYQAYHLATNGGTQSEVDALMNTAVRTHFAQNQKAKKLANFDHLAPYTYSKIEQLILHLSFLHQTTDEVAVPAWLFQKHPAATAKAFQQSDHQSYAISGVDALFQWEELKLLEVIAEDLAAENIDSKKLAAATNRRAQLLMAPQLLDTADQMYLEGWHRSIWNGLDAWGEKDPVLKNICVPLKVVYYQSQVRLEDYFMDKGFKPKAATHLALATLQTYVDPYLSKL